MQIYHNSHKSEYRFPFGAVTCGALVWLSIFAEGADEVFLKIAEDGKDPEILSMESPGECFKFELRFTVPNHPTLIWYSFILKLPGKEELYYGNNKNSFGGEGCLSGADPLPYQITVYEKREAPAWFKDALIYQIWPDSFCRGEGFDEALAKEYLSMERGGPLRELRGDWYEKPSYAKNEDGSISKWQFFGGTLAGICEKLPYIKSLGFSAIYLNPIFEAASCHRYDTANYMKIDPLLGCEEDFQLLCKEAEALGIHIILDGVFNHTGADSIYFDRWGNYARSSDLSFPAIKGEALKAQSTEGEGDTEGAPLSPTCSSCNESVRSERFFTKGKEEPAFFGAFQSELSPFRNWYRFNDELTCGYESWWGVSDLPLVNELESSYVEFICGRCGVIEKWISLGASGFRLDVADELPDAFIEKIRASLDRAGKENVLIGEVWEDASNKISYNERRKYFSGRELDGVMNYVLRDALLSFALGKANTLELMKHVMGLIENYPPENLYSSFNLISSHDRPRVLTLLKEHTKTRENAARLLKMLTTLQYALPGVPCVYYGDEAGMEGGSDPENRAGFPWGLEDKALVEFFTRLGEIYNSSKALKEGSFKPADFLLPCAESVFAFERCTEKEHAFIIANRSLSAPAFVSVKIGEDGCVFENAFTHERVRAQDGVLPLIIKACECEIYFKLD